MQPSFRVIEQSVKIKKLPRQEKNLRVLYALSAEMITFAAIIHEHTPKATAFDTPS